MAKQRMQHETNKNTRQMPTITPTLQSQTSGLLIVRGCRWRCTGLACNVCRQVLQQLVFLRFTRKAEIVHFALKLHKKVRQIVVELQPAITVWSICQKMQSTLKYLQGQIFFNNNISMANSLSRHTYQVHHTHLQQRD